MDTIIYLKTEETYEDKPEEKVRPFCRIQKIRGAYGIPERDQLLVVTLHENTRGERWVCELQDYLRAFYGYSVSVESLTAPGFDSWLLQNHYKAVWEKQWQIPPFLGFRRCEYAVFLLEKVAKDLRNRYSTEKLRFYLTVIVLGFEGFVPEVLEPYLSWIHELLILQRKETLTKTGQQAGTNQAGLKQSGIQQTGSRQTAPEAYLIHLAETEGLAVNYRLAESEKSLLCLRETERPILVLDLSGEPRFLPEGTGKEVYWIDMDASDEKNHRFSLICPKIQYFSMKEEWRRLDTARKNGYNTLVN